MLYGVLGEIETLLKWHTELCIRKFNSYKMPHAVMYYKVLNMLLWQMGYLPKAKLGIKWQKMLCTEAQLNLLVPNVDLT